MQEVKWNEMKKVEGGSEDGDSILWGIVYVTGRIYCEVKNRVGRARLVYELCQAGPEGLGLE